ncbi:MAG: hypothetical protein ChlgKO_07920 [Chlamydiales bacterium]
MKIPEIVKNIYNPYYLDKIEEQIVKVEKFATNHFRSILLVTAGYAAYTTHGIFKNEAEKVPFCDKIITFINIFSIYSGLFLTYFSFISYLNQFSHKERNSSIGLTDLTMEAKNRSLKPFSGREKELDQLATALCTKNLGNPILVGNAGCGKTALVEGFAQRIQSGDVPEELKDAKIYVLNIEALFAGASLVGDAEARIQTLFKFLEREKNAILFIDEVHRVMSNKFHNSETNISEKLKPAMTSGKIRIIGATTPGEYLEITRDRAMEDRFIRIDLGDLKMEEAIAILKGVKEKRFETPYKVIVPDEIISYALNRLQEQEGYIRKAFKLLEVTCVEIAHENAKNKVVAKPSDTPGLTKQAVDNTLRKFPYLSGENSSNYQSMMYA